MFTAALVTTLATFTPAASAVAGLLAQTAAPTTKPAGQDGGFLSRIFGGGMMVPMIILLVVFYVFMISSRRKQEKQKKDALGGIKCGDRVQTIGGILGKVVEADETKVLLKVDESSNTKIWFSRSAIHRVLEEEKEKDKDKAETK